MLAPGDFIKLLLLALVCSQVICINALVVYNIYCCVLGRSLLVLQ